MIPVSYYAPDELTSPPFACAFAKGCKGTITTEDELFPGPVALFGSPSKWPVLRKAQAAGREWYYGDHAYFGRKTYYRITKNAYQHDGTGEGTPDRFLVFNKPVQPWRSSGSHILVCPNSPVHFQLHGLNVDQWIAETVATIKAHTDRKIKIRWKRGQTTYIRSDLANAWATVVFSSAAALDSLIQGVPVFVTAPFAAAYRMGLSDLSKIEAPFFPDDREPFLWSLASHQWTLQEIYTGMAWASLQESHRRAA